MKIKPAKINTVINEVIKRTGSGVVLSAIDTQTIPQKGRSIRKIPAILRNIVLIMFILLSKFYSRALLEMCTLTKYKAVFLIVF